MSSRSRDAFAALIQPHCERLYRLAYRLTGARADAEDLLQDVLVKLYQRRDELNAIEDLAPWLARVLYNQFVDDTRRQRRRPVTLAVVDDTGEQAPDPSPNPEDLATHRQTLQQLDAAVRRLPDDQRQVLLLADAEGYTLPEIADLTGLPLGTLKSRLHRARARLRELLPTAREQNMEPFAPVSRVGG